ncbi:MAG TPA: hypothetical protein VHY84_27230 [Bryobacteraceae bacterium]|nr:hypothetical protein [Bryobacteraceae bacterium]
MIGALSPKPSAASHIHLPSVHIRATDGTGFDYEEDLYIQDREGDLRVERVIRFAFVEGEEPVLVRQTRDELCAEELTEVEDRLPVLMNEGSPAAAALMQESASREFERQIRITAAEEQVCSGCGCSETRACSGGCSWATETLCSKCADIDAPLVEVVSDAEATRFLRARRAAV